MIVLGIKGGGHDTGAAILREYRGGLNIVAISEERLNRCKHSRQYPLMAIDYCLGAFGLRSLAEVDVVAFDWHHGEFSDENYAVSPTRNPESDHRPAFNHAVHHNLKLGRAKPVQLHHLAAHAASGYYLSPFQQAAILVVDFGVGLYTGRGTELTTHLAMGYGQTIEEGRFTERPVAVGTGMLFDGLTRHLGFDQFGAGKTMALASYGRFCQRNDLLPVPPDRHRDAMLDYRMTLRHLFENVPQFSKDECFKGAEGILDEQWVNLARQVQELLQEDMVFLAGEAVKKSGTRNLCLAGGVAMSCVTNRHVIDSGVCDNVFIQPAASDEGVPLGAALAGYYLHGGTIRAEMNHAYLGLPNDPNSVEDVLKESGLPYRPVDDAAVAALIAAGKIVGRSFGGAEYGARALGNRSILADPRRPYMTEVLNRRIKHRELFRPFAPSVHADKAERYFDLPFDAPFMIVAATVKPEARELIPAVVHVDGSCRPQTVHPEQNPGFYNLIEEFGKKTGVYCLINTSFNDNGEPIVETYRDAIDSFLRTGLDHLYIDGFLVDRPAEEATTAMPSPLERAAEANERYEELARRFCDYERYLELRGRLEERKAA